MLLISPRFAYLVAGLCSLYLSVAPLLSRWHGPVSFVTLGFWIGAGLLIIAAIIQPSEETNIVVIRLALIGSAVTTVLLVYGIARFVAFRLGYIRGKAQVFAYQPNTFDRVNRIASKPILILFLISSVASLLISVLLMRWRRQSS